MNWREKREKKETSHFSLKLAHKTGKNRNFLFFTWKKRENPGFLWATITTDRLTYHFSINLTRFLDFCVDLELKNAKFFNSHLYENGGGRGEGGERN